ncbi:translation initiation factor IF-2 N-terminal domain-containing protein [Corynebacterium choanae]|uniref:Ribonuclease E n=1 Tax=Corynebacterium choanae TaxID=1862358 RepID=A0A3G6J805_9CORY|nr:translation initiation factor IF-2 N-terminal domain-containing protein [Corynebacterium choanae]AZA14116.1 Ribonuclease E [Corynebacterium choanae]
MARQQSPTTTQSASKPRRRRSNAATASTGDTSASATPRGKRTTKAGGTNDKAASKQQAVEQTPKKAAKKTAKKTATKTAAAKKKQSTTASTTGNKAAAKPATSRRTRTAQKNTTKARGVTDKKVREQSAKAVDPVIEDLVQVSKETAKNSQQLTGVSEATIAAAREIDRSTLGEKLRVHQLAKLLGLVSKELVALLAQVGIEKKAVSSITYAEAALMLDKLVEPTLDTGDQTVEVIRYRVGKNVENEIHQIESKIEEELEQRLDETPAVIEQEPDSLVDDDPSAVADQTESAQHEALQAEDAQAADAEDDDDEEDDEELDVDIELDDDDFLDEDYEFDDDHDDDDDQDEELVAPPVIDIRAAAAAEVHAELLEDVVSASTPVPADTNYETPLFKAPVVVPGPAPVAPPSDDQRESTQAERGPRRVEEPLGIKGSTRLEAQRRRRVERRRDGQRNDFQPISDAEFRKRRQAIHREMVIRDRQRHDGRGTVTQAVVVEDGKTVEHYITTDTQNSTLGNIYLGRVQNVLPSMEAAFIDIGTGRNAVLYAGEINWRNTGLTNRNRRIENILKSGDQVLVQVAKDPVGHKGARLTTQISLAGRFLVYVPEGRSAGISRKLPESERRRLKGILKQILPDDGGAIIRTAAEGVSAEEIGNDADRLLKQWASIQEITAKEKAKKGAKPVTLYEEPPLLVKLIRDLFNEDVTKLTIDGAASHDVVTNYVSRMAPDLLDRIEQWDRHAQGGVDAFVGLDIEPQLAEALSRKVWLPSGGSLVIDYTEAMTVIDVNTGSNTGKSGNLEQTVTANNIEAAEEIVRQIRLRDIGGMIVIDFIDMVLEENQDLVLRRLAEALMHDRTRHQLGEVTSLGLVQITRKRLGGGLQESFTTECQHCAGSGRVTHDDPVLDWQRNTVFDDRKSRRKAKEDKKKRAAEQAAKSTQKPARPVGEHPAAAALHRQHTDGDSAGTLDREQNGDTAQHPPAASAASTSLESTAREDHHDGSAQSDSTSERKQAAATAHDTAATESGDDRVKTANTRSRRRRRAGRSATAQAAGAEQVDNTTDVAAATDTDPAAPADQGETTSHVPAAPSGSRGRRRRRAAMPQPASTQSGATKSDQHSAHPADNTPQDSVEAESQAGAAPQPHAGQSATPAGAKRGAKRRRARTTPGEQRAQDTVAIALDALATADREDPDEPSGRSYVPDEQYQTQQENTASKAEAAADDNGEAAYRAAVEAFERSPRRQRRVRGNSRSDVPPKRSDFISGPMGSDGIDSLDDQPAKESDTASNSDTTPGNSPAAVPTRRRSGRKRVRAGAPTVNPTSVDDTVASTTADDSDTLSTNEKKQSAQHPPAAAAAEPTPASGKPRRGRRRAVRTSAVEHQSHTQQPGKDNSTQQQQETVNTAGQAVGNRKQQTVVETSVDSAAPARRGRGRRRAAMRSTQVMHNQEKAAALSATVAQPEQPAARERNRSRSTRRSTRRK